METRYGYVLLPVSIENAPDGADWLQLVEERWDQGEFDLTEGVIHDHIDAPWPPKSVEAFNEFDALQHLGEMADTMLKDL